MRSETIRMTAMAVLLAAVLFTGACVPINLGTIKGSIPMRQGDAALARNDTQTAAAKYQEAAAAGHPAAQYQVGMMHLRGKGLPRDGRRAVELVKKSAEAGYAPAQSTYGYWLLTGKGVKADQDGAVEWLRKAAAQEDGTAAYMLAHMYGRGVVVKQDRNEAIRWFRVAQANGYPVHDQVLATGDPTKDPGYRQAMKKTKPFSK